MAGFKKNVFQKNQVLGKKRELPSLMLNTGKEIKFVKKNEWTPQQTWWLPNNTDVEKRKNCLPHLSLLLWHYPDIDPKFKNSKTCKLEELGKTILKHVTDRVQFIHKIIEVHNWRQSSCYSLAENPMLHALHGGGWGEWRKRLSLGLLKQIITYNLISLMTPRAHYRNPGVTESLCGQRRKGNWLTGRQEEGTRK